MKKSLILAFAALLGLQILLSGCTATTGSGGGATGSGSSGSVYNDDY